jgi:hypothetical protein
MLELLLSPWKLACRPKLRISLSIMPHPTVRRLDMFERPIRLYEGTDNALISGIKRIWVSAPAEQHHKSQAPTIQLKS